MVWVAIHTYIIAILPAFAFCTEVTYNFFFRTSIYACCTEPCTIIDAGYGDKTQPSSNNFFAKMVHDTIFLATWVAYIFFQSFLQSFYFRIIFNYFPSMYSSWFEVCIFLFFITRLGDANW